MDYYSFKKLFRWGDSETSQNAAASVAPHINEIQLEVLAFINEHPGGVTQEDVEIGLGKSNATYRTRVSELVQMGLVEYAGIKKRLRRTKCSGQVWKVTQVGVNFLKERGLA